jgi:hypothetical protein
MLLRNPHSNLMINTVTDEKILTTPLKNIKKEIDEETF